MEEAIFYTSAFVATVATYPLDVIKTNQQIKGSLREILTKHGVYGFYKGIGWQVASLPTFWTIFFASRKHINFTCLPPQWANAANIYAASMIASTAASPIFVTKTFHQVGGGNVHARIMKNGPLGYFKGTSSTFLINTKLVPQFMIFDTLTKNYGLPIAEASVASKLTSAMITYPFEVTRTYSRVNNLPIRQTIIEMLKKEKNPLGLYRGFLSYTVLSTINFTAMMFLQDYLKRHYM